MRYMIEHYFRSWRSHAAVQLATLVVLALTVCVWLSAHLTEKNLRIFLASWGDSVEMVVFLKDEVQVEDKSKVSDFLKKTGAFSEIRFVSKEDAAREFSARAGHLAAGLLNRNEIGNPLPESFNLKLISQVGSKSTLDRLRELAEALMQLPGVDDVAFGQGWVENYAAALRALEWINLVILSVLALGAGLVVYQSIGNAVHQRRQEIEILELIGASPWRVRGPFIFEGGMQSLLAAAFALGFIGILSQVVIDHFGATWTAWGAALTWKGLEAREVWTTLIGSTVFGVLAATQSVRKIANGWAAATREDGV